MLNMLDMALINAQNKMLLAKNIDVFEIEDAPSNNAFSKIDSTIKTTGQGLYHTLLLVGGFGAVIFLIIAFIYYGVSSAGQNKEKAKDKIFTVLIATAGIFAAVAIISLFQTIGNGINDELRP